MKRLGTVRFIFASLTLVGSLNLISCAKDNGNGGGGAPAPAGTDPNYATTPQPCNMYQSQPNQMATCMSYYNQGYYGNAHILPQAWPHGAWMWPTQWQPQVGNCGCQSGYQPVYHSSFGLACAPQAYFGSGNGYGGYPGYGGGYSGGYGFSGVFFGVSFNWGASFGPAINNQNLNIPQTYYGQSCGNSAPAQGCDARSYNSCGGGYMCQPVGGGSSIGVCVRDYYNY